MPFSPILNVEELFTSRITIKPIKENKIEKKENEEDWHSDSIYKKLKNGLLTPISYDKLVDIYGIKLISTRAGNTALYEFWDVEQKLTIKQKKHYNKTELLNQPKDLKIFYTINEGEIYLEAYKEDLAGKLHKETKKRFKLKS